MEARMSALKRLASICEAKNLGFTLRRSPLTEYPFYVVETWPRSRPTATRPFTGTTPEEALSRAANATEAAG